MIKVLTKGSLTKKITCKRCKSELEYEPEDVRSDSYEDSPMQHTITCAVCLPALGASFSSVTVPPPWVEDLDT